MGEELPPWFWDRTTRLLAEPDFVHTDSCGWMGGDAAHPCTCQVPELLRAIAERVDLEATARAVSPPLPAGHPSDDVDRASDQLPDVTTLPDGPKPGTTRQWLTVWKPVRVRIRGAWRVGIVKNQVQEAEGTWALLIEYAGDGTQEGWPHAMWVVHDATLIRPIAADPSP